MAEHASALKSQSRDKPVAAASPVAASAITDARTSDQIGIMGQLPDHLPRATTLQDLRTTVGRAAPPALPSGHQPVQRVIEIDGKPFKRESDTKLGREAARLINDVALAVQSHGYKPTVGLYEQLHTWLSPNKKPSEKFDSFDHLLKKLFDLELVYKPQKFGTTGPKTLGSRPGFTGDANKLEYGQKHGDTARRHVIASSTLGLAIEHSTSPVTSINAFFTRHGQKKLVVEHDGTLNDTVALKQAQINAWEMLHNHLGNLWIGPSANNTAIGFIRGPLLHAIDELQKLPEDLNFINLHELVSIFQDPQGPMNKNARSEWDEFASIAASDLADKSVDAIEKGIFMQHVNELYLLPNLSDVESEMLSVIFDEMKGFEDLIPMGQVMKKLDSLEARLDEDKKDIWLEICQALADLTKDKTSLSINRDTAIALLLDYERNADLDPPHQASKEYEEALRMVYAAIQGAISTGDMDIFAPNQVLDYYMTLDTGTLAAMNKKKAS